MYRTNLRLLYLLSVTTGLSFASALLVPFFMGNGMNQAQIMLLQTIFSVAVVLLEVPTGYVADRFGRAMSLRLGSLTVCFGFMGYSLLHGFGQFVLAELLLAVGVALLSGANEALAYDSLLADGQSERFRKFMSTVQTLVFATIAVCAPIGSLMASHVGIRLVLFLDGMLAVVGFAAAVRLKEPERQCDKQEQALHHPFASMRAVVRFCLNGHEQIPLLIGLSAILSAMTYFGYWFAPAYFGSVGIPLAAFGFILAVRSLLKAILSQAAPRLNRIMSDKQQLWSYSALGVTVYVLLALLRQPWAILFLAGFDAIQALQGPVISDRLQQLTPSNIRAQVGSVASLSRRGAYGLLGPLFGLGIDRSVSWGLALCAATFAGTSFCLLLKLQKKGAL